MLTDLFLLRPHLSDTDTTAYPHDNNNPNKIQVVTQLDQLTRDLDISQRKLQALAEVCRK
jgi:hypothetical protein